MLKVLRVSKCDSSKNVLSFSMVRDLSQLLEMDIVNCSNMEVIVADENKDNSRKTEMAEFLQLRFLMLKGLPQLRSFFPTVNAPSTSQTRHKHLITEPGPDEIASKGELGASLALFNRMVCSFAKMLA